MTPPGPRRADDSYRQKFVGNNFFTVTWIDRDGGRIKVDTAGRTFNFAGSQRDAVFFRRMLAAVIGTAFRASAETVSNWANDYD